METNKVRGNYGVRVIVFILICLFSALNILPVFVADKIARENNIVSLRVTHWPGDYYYYLSQFKLGEKNIFLSEDLFTHEFKDKTLVGWVNVFLGRIFYTFGISSFDAYPVIIVITTIVFLVLCYNLLTILFEHKSEGQYLALIAFALFLFSNAVPKFDWGVNPVGIWFYDYWFNIGLPLTRLGGVPHQLIERSLVVISLILFLKPLSRQWAHYITTGLIAFTLASIEPVHFLIALGTMMLSVLVISIKKKKADWVPIIIFALCGLPVVIYLKYLFMSPPFTQLSAWEAVQQGHIYPGELILFHGPLFLFGILGMTMQLYEVYKSREILHKNLVIFIFIASSLILFFSPIPSLLGIVNVRFLSAPLILGYSYFSVIFLTKSIKKYLKKDLLRRIALNSLVVGIILLSLPSLYAQEKKRLEFDPKNLVFFVSNEAIEMYKYAQNNSNPKDIFLVYWPFNSSFPALTGKRVYDGHPLLTINEAEKSKNLFNFFDGKMSEAEAKHFLKSNGITKVIGYGGNLYLRENPNLSVEYDNQYLTLYKVLN